MNTKTRQALLMLLCCCARVASADENALSPRSEARFEEVLSVLKSRCFGCHGPKKQKGKLDFSLYPDLTSALLADDIWKKMRTKVEEGEMPPKKAEQLTAEQKEKLLDWYKATFEALTEPVPGPSLPRRLTRREYQNSLEDLLAIELQQEIARDGFRYMRPPPSIVEKLLLPDPPGASGFNNDASVLGLNEAALIKYLQIAQYALGQIDSVKGAREQVFAGHKEPAPLLGRFLRRAFRRPVAEDEIAVYLGIYEKSRAAGTSFDRAVKDALIAALTSSKFLYRIETSTSATEAYRVSDFDLATRLSYFLWSSTPDGELLRLAGAGKLSEPAVLSAQVQRMLKSPKIRELSRNFAGQWLGFRELLDSRTLVKGGNKMVKLRLAMHDEALLFFEYLVKENRPVLEILDSGKTFLNKILAGTYGVRGFRSPVQKKIRGREDAPDPLILWDIKDPNRGGYLTMAATMAITSAPQRTSPIRRGVWVLDKLLGTPVADPPPAIPSLEQAGGGRRNLTVREQMKIHASKETCNKCHQHIDPLGLGLENFGPMGRFRSKGIDAAGKLPGGQEFSTPAELKKVLKSDFQGQIRRNIVVRMLSYALGRRLRYYDEPVISLLVRDLEKGEDRLHLLIEGIVRSVPFQYRAPSTAKINGAGVKKQ
ncbi:MAG: DUF1592 domain-containing protein [Planctomycetota bacterium]|nr:DUF1592 domain-containing protein [Planctomycetota bacterium]